MNACLSTVIAVSVASIGCGAEGTSLISEPATNPLGRANARIAPAPAGFVVTKIAPGAFVVTTQPHATNSLLVRTPNDTVILVDTPFTPPDTEELLAWSQRQWGRLPTFAVNSHWHFDATGGNQVLVNNGVEVWSSQRTATALRQRGEQLRLDLMTSFSKRNPDTAKKLRSLRPTPATRIIDIRDSVELVLGGETVQLVYPGPSHSADSIGVFFPARRLLYGGCAVRSDARIGYRGEADLANWPRALETFAALRPKLVVPGHGRRFDPEMIAESIAAARAEAAK